MKRSRIVIAVMLHPGGASLMCSRRPGLRAPLLLVGWLALAAALQAGQEPPALFTGSAAFGTSPLPSAGALRSRSATAHLELLDHLPPDGTGWLRLNLFDDVSYSARFIRHGRPAASTRAWSGTLKEAPHGSVTIIRNNAGMLAVVRVPGAATYEVRSTADGAATIRQIHVTAPRCTDSAAAAMGGARRMPALNAARLAWSPGPLAGPQPAAITPYTYGCDDGTVIDIMIVYTDDARAAAGSTAAMESNIALAIQEANDALANSQIDTSLRLVHTHEVNYTETGDFGTDLDRLVNPSDGFLDDVPPLRDQYGADCVSFWSHYNFFGVGFFPDGSLQGINASGITLMDWRGYSGLLLAHELGHNLWCAHDRAHTLDTPYAPYSYGFIEPGSAWQDIMAQAPGVPWIPHYANPGVIWPGPVPPNPGPTGVAVGNPDPCDVALTIMDTRHIIANFRPTALPGLPSVLYVNAAAAPGGDGLSWATALRDLQDALCRAGGSNGAVQQIWVAAGTYKPDRGGAGRTAGFNLRNHLAIYGGFAGTETQLSQRNWKANLTILSGDIGTVADNSDNSFHAVTCIGNDRTARLDGFEITGGQADSTNWPDNRGGGLLCDNAGPTIAHCTFTGNHAGDAGGAFSSINSSNPLIAECTFLSNTADGSGGALAVDQSAPTLRNCLFRLNSAPTAGAVIHSGDSPAFYASCRFLANTATGQSGGAVGSFNASPTFVNCLFSGNNCQWYGGGLFGFGAGSENLKLVNSTFSRNSAVIYGGGVAVDQPGPALANTILWGNTATASIEEQQIVRFGFVAVNVSQCTVQGWTGAMGGSGNNGSNPLFVDDDGADGTVGTLDDDLRLGGGSPGIDTGSTAGLPADTADLNGNGNTAEATPLDLDAHPRVLAFAVDRGAYEAIPVIPADFDHDGDVDGDDYAHFAACATRSRVAQNNAACADAKLDADSDVDMRDFALFQRCYSGPQQPASADCAD